VQPAGDRPAHLISCEIISEAGRSAISCHLRLSFWNGVLALRASGGTIQPAFDAVRVIHVCTVESPPPSCCRDLVEADDTHNPPGGLGGFPLLESIFEQQGVHVLSTANAPTDGTMSPNSRGTPVPLMVR
jgi:hypothetical protein